MSELGEMMPMSTPSAQLGGVGVAQAVGVHAFLDPGARARHFSSTRT
ncbi:MAG: hypothetical protein U1D55_19475 [Phycisphaerae bacterium]